MLNSKYKPKLQIINVLANEKQFNLAQMQSQHNKKILV